MPLAFGSLLGGLMTLIGTSPNVIVSRMREELLGEPFTMFDFLPVGAGIAAGRRDLPRLRLSPAAGRPQGQRLGGSGVPHRGLHDRGDAARRARPWPARPWPTSRPWATARSRSPRSSASIFAATRRRRTGCSTPDDVLILQGEQAALERVIARAKLELATKEVAAAPVAGVGDRRGRGGDRRRIAAGRPHGRRSWRLRGALSGQRGRGQPQRRAADAAAARDAVPRRAT